MHLPAFTLAHEIGQVHIILLPTLTGLAALINYAAPHETYKNPSH